MRTRSQSREQRPPPPEGTPVVIEPLRIEYPFQEDPTVEPMADTRTMAQLLQAPTGSRSFNSALVGNLWTKCLAMFKIIDEQVSQFDQTRANAVVCLKEPSFCSISSSCNLSKQLTNCVTCGGPFLTTTDLPLMATYRTTFLMLRNMQNQGQNLQSQMANLTDMLSKFVTANTASTSGSGALPGNTVTNPKEDLKDVQPPVVQIQSRNPNPEPNVAPVVAPVPNTKPTVSLPYPSRRDNEKSRNQANEQIDKFYEIFKEMSFEISFTDALVLMPKFASTHRT
ncbi:hypothetical protein Tco_0655785 [Tanacetum coccineum]|uniref:Reverse transcriptase domain-containing protein n=1 Tax=Tanacetum coccineum TaxID=301880 RepID=A0ABQ4X6Y3_9ASTR